MGQVRRAGRGARLRSCPELIVHKFLLGASRGSRRGTMPPAVFEGKPIIGIAGGIGSGKTFVAKMFGEEGCLVINSDDMVRRVYHDETVKHTLKQWWGKMIFEPNGEIDRSAVARKIFNFPSERVRLEK